MPGGGMPQGCPGLPVERIHRGPGGEQKFRCPGIPGDGRVVQGGAGPVVDKRGIGAEGEQMGQDGMVELGRRAHQDGASRPVAGVDTRAREKRLQGREVPGEEERVDSGVVEIPDQLTGKHGYTITPQQISFCLIEQV